MAKKGKWDRESLEITHVRGSGPGGQNRNKRMSGVRVRHLPTGLTVLSTERRSQGQNLASALRRLEDKHRDFTYRPPPRTKTKPTRGSVTRRLVEKKTRSLRKNLRKMSRDDE